MHDAPGNRSTYPRDIARGDAAGNTRPSAPAEVDHIHAAIRSLTSQLTLRACSDRPLRASMERAYRTLLTRQYLRLEGSGDQPPGTMR